ncbi:hypothetical protein N7447_009372 [Penicillium robsamsonii]|uniref:uncharacterized protein n=1 Tax=Penicillium robsamsonii TaxID=1792511 RepID=UPI0025471150|nr:uncharacterized protein N7447_009372 [Penicillium robsamsonii]KAJ5817139.1 hypothetical protein N7447_009372 [Penicillium robsamsonii]
MFMLGATPTREMIPPLRWQTVELLAKERGLDDGFYEPYLDYLIDEKDEEVEHKKHCDMDVAGGKQVQGMVAMIFAAARKFLNPP